MPERKWGLITSGATFESLVTAVIFFEDPQAALFGRRGKDGGQDARSGDGTRVFQAKHHESGSAAAAIRDAQHEAKKIEEYRRVAHTRYVQWAGVTHWRLVTNATFNPTDHERWVTEIVPLFGKIGLVADYWERASLDALLDRHPEIHRSYFENESRVFLSLPEVVERLPSQEPFLRRDELGPFCGRMREKAEIIEFLASSKLFLVVHGAGGTGKTRLLVEAVSEIAGEGEWQALWANVESMAATGAWFDAVVPERSTVLIVDEPTSEGVLQQLAEQLGGRAGRIAKWKIIVALRSPKDPVLRFLRLARMKQRVQELALFPLSPTEAEEMCFELLRTGTLAGMSEESKRDAARQLSQRFSRHAVWLTLAIQHLEDRGELTRVAADAEALADEYIAEIETSQTDCRPETVRAIVRWVALLGTVNRNDDSTIALIGERCRIATVVDVRERLAGLVRRRALSERGAYSRLVELKPDVLRDHVLLRWLARDGGGPHPQVSSDGLELIESVREGISKGTLSGLGRAVLVSLARTEYILRLAGHDFGLMRGLFVELEATMARMSATQRVAIADILKSVAHYQPSAIAALARSLRVSRVADETVEGLFVSEVVGQDDVIMALAWPLFGAAMGAQSHGDQEAILRELCALVEAEAELSLRRPRGLPNDGKRAAALVTRVLEGGPQFWSEYDEAAKRLAVELIDALAGQPPSQGQIALLDALVQPLLLTERRQVWADDRGFIWRTFSIPPGSSASLARDAVLARVKECLQTATSPHESRKQLWRVFSRVRDGDASGRLTWTYDVLMARHPGIEELSAAREVWDWYRRYERDPDTKAKANALEAIYEANALAKEFLPLLPDFEDRAGGELRASAKAEELARAASPNEIAGFVERAVMFLGNDYDLGKLRAVTWALGSRAESHEVIRQFVRMALMRTSIDARREFVVDAAVSWLAAVRQTLPERAHLLARDLCDACGDDERRAHLLERIYCRVPRLHGIGCFTPDERALLRGAAHLFRGTYRDIPFIGGLALSVGHDWSSLRPLLEDILADVDAQRLPLAMHTLVDAIYWAVRDVTDFVPLSGLGEWLLSQLLMLPDIDDVPGNTEWCLSEVLTRVGPPDVTWLVSALRRQQERESASEKGLRSQAISRNARFSRYVRRIDATHASNAGVIAAVDGLLDFMTDDGSVGYYLPDVLRDVDPDGLVVPAAVAERAPSARDAEGVRRLARIAGAYAVNSSAWRTMALATIRAAKALGAQSLRLVYGSLGDRGVRSWSAPVGEVPAMFVDAVAQARAALNDETQPDLQPYWQQRLAFAEIELREQEERAKEERGE